MTILTAALMAVLAAYRLLMVRPSLPKPGVELPDEDQNYGFGDGPHLSGGCKEEFYTFLPMGQDTGGDDNTDTLMMIAYDIPNQILNVMNVPRDTMVNVPWDIKHINSVYSYAPYCDKGSIQFLKEEVSYFIGFQPDYTIVVEWEAVGELVDVIGGVEFDVPIDVNYDDSTQNLYIHLSVGLQDIDDDKTMQLPCWRRNSDVYGDIYSDYPNGDPGRIETQQASLETVVEKCFNSISPDTIPKMAQIFLDNVDTNGSLTVNNLAWFAKEAIVGGLSMESVHFTTLPSWGASVYNQTYHNYQSHVTPIPDGMLELVNTRFNPYLGGIELSELDLAQVNRDGSLSSTRGHVEDTKAAKPPVKGDSDSSEPTDNSMPEVLDTPEPPVTPTATPEATPSAPAESQPPTVETPAVTSTLESILAAVPVPTPTPTSIPAFTLASNAPVDGFGPGMEPTGQKENEMTANEIALTTVRALNSEEDQDIKYLETGHLIILADYFVFCTVTSATQIEALAGVCEKALRDAREPPHHIGGHRGGTWILLDFSPVVMHTFNEKTREFYDLEHLWGDAAPVDLSGVLAEN